MLKSNWIEGNKKTGVTDKKYVNKNKKLKKKYSR